MLVLLHVLPMRPCDPRLGPREVSTIVWAAAKAGVPPPTSPQRTTSASPAAAWLPALLARAARLQHRLNPQVGFRVYPREYPAEDSTQLLVLTSEIGDI